MTAMWVPMVLLNWDSHASPHFDYCDVINAMVLLTTPFASQKYG